MVDRLIFGDEIVVTGGAGRSGDREGEEKAKEWVHGRKCVTGDYPKHALR